jgi:hypothetical protein
MLILQLLIRNEYLDCKEMVLKNSSLLLLALILTLINGTFTLIMIIIESRALQEPKLEYILNSFKAR